jgi:hypothetical protein
VEDQCAKHRCSSVVPLMSVTHTVELIPEYGEKVDEKVSSAVCLESYDPFFEQFHGQGDLSHIKYGVHIVWVAHSGNIISNPCINHCQDL